MTLGRITEIGWPAIRRRSNFRAAVEESAARIVDHKDGLRPILRWLTNDVGRSSVLARALMWDARDGGVSVADILASVRQRGTASDGRVMQVFRRAERAGIVVVEPGSGRWTSRRLIFRPEFVEAIRERIFIEIESASLVLPEIALALPLLAQDEYLLRFLARLSRYHMVPPETMGPRNPSMRLFLEHEAGLIMLYDLIGRQRADRKRLLEGAPFSRISLSRHGVSRSHVGRVFDLAAEAGYLAFPTRNRVVFSQAMSEEAERHFALTFHVIGACALEALDDKSILWGRAARDASH